MTPPEYLQSRGVTLQMADAWGLVLSEDRIEFPVQDEHGALLGSVYLRPEGNPRWWVSDPNLRHKAVYGLSHAVALGQPVVTVVESQTDAIALNASGMAAVAAISCILTGRQADLIAAHWRSARLDFDDDLMGRMGARQAAGLLRARGVLVGEGSP